MRQFSERLIAAMLLLFLTVYVGYQLYRYYFSPIQTETAFQHSVTESIAVEGVIIRSETVIPRTQSGVESISHDDGTRVAVGQTVAEFYSDSVGDSQVGRMRELEREIAALKEAQNPIISNFSNAESISRDIKYQMNNLTQMASLGRYHGAANVRPALVTLLNKKQVALGKEENFEGRIQRLQSEYERLSASAAVGNRETAVAPVAGYYVREVDGLEESLTPAQLEHSSIQDILSLLDSQAPTEPSGNIGKVVTNPNWYFVTTTPKYDIQWMQVGQELSLTFDVVDEPIPVTVTAIISENSVEDAALILSTKYVTGALLNLRHTQAVLSMDQFTGLKISKTAIRFQDGVQGVYVLSKNTIFFKRVDPIYEELTYIISREGGDAQDVPTVKLFDQVIVKGLDLNDGKVVT